ARERKPNSSTACTTPIQHSSSAPTKPHNSVQNLTFTAANHIGRRHVTKTTGGAINPLTVATPPHPLWGCQGRYHKRWWLLLQSRLQIATLR
ncbi:hypothetical protein A2U01_0029398, partial [Trifolium medium]|nr:hypothetical protein [Trifolium medium]